jgi:hypothetical protein
MFFLLVRAEASCFSLWIASSQQLTRKLYEFMRAGQYVEIGWTCTDGALCHFAIKAETSIIAPLSLPTASKASEICAGRGHRSCREKKLAR